MQPAALMSYPPGPCADPPPRHIPKCMRMERNNMIAVNLHDITKFYGGRQILAGLDFAVADDARIGLVGANGAGKSTLLRIISGLDETHAGDIARRKGLRSAHL